jgi:hypothetical protein
VSVVANADESLGIYLGAQSAYSDEFRDQLAQIRNTYAKGADPEVDDALEAHIRVYVVNTILLALNWRDGAAADSGIATIVPEAPVTSAAKGTIRYLDYLGIEQGQCDAPLLVVETKRPSSPLPRLASNTATPGTLSDVLALALQGEPLHGEWQDWLDTIRDYARSVAAKVAMPKRVVMTNGEWIVVFLDPTDAFSQDGTKSSRRILVFPTVDQVEARYAELYGALEYSRVTGSLEPIESAKLFFFIRPEEVSRLVHGLRVRYIETPPAIELDAPSPMIKVVPLLFVGTRSNGWVVVGAYFTNRERRNRRMVIAETGRW